MLEYRLRAHRVDNHGSVASAKATELLVDTSVEGRSDALNPVELLLAALAACMIKGIERVCPILDFDLRGVEVKLHAIRQDSPPKIASIEYEIFVDTDEPERRLDLLHSNVRKFGTISNTLAEATRLAGTLRRMPPPTVADAQEHEAEIERIAQLGRAKLDAIPEPGTDTLHEGP